MTLAQVVEQETENLRVGGANPSGHTSLSVSNHILKLSSFVNGISVKNTSYATVAQLVELQTRNFFRSYLFGWRRKEILKYTFNVKYIGSSPIGGTKIVVKTRVTYSLANYPYLCRPFPVFYFSLSKGVV